MARSGGLALNYARAAALLRAKSGRVCGIALCDQETGRTAEVQASVVINATGAWADDLRAHLGRSRRLRHLRGSHLIFSARRLPLRRAVSFLHPADRRPVFAVPWEGVTLFGTTDVDHGSTLEAEPTISAEEADYLIAALQYAFPPLGLMLDDVQAAFAGVRPVVDTGQSDPSKESREHVLWNENDLLTVTGGKLTTFRLMAHDALEAVRARLPRKPKFETRQRVLDANPDVYQTDRMDPPALLRLVGRYGADAPELIAAAGRDELTPVGETSALWAELRWAARAEGVVHLDDLLLRRVRLGLVLPHGGVECMERVHAIVQPELGWSGDRWAREAAAYEKLASAALRGVRVNIW